LDSDLRLQHWGVPLGGLANLMRREHNLAQAAEFAQQLAAYARANPGAAIQLAGYSGGGGMALMVAEALPADVRLRKIVLVHAAVSRDYDLCKVLSHLDGDIINLHSTADSVV